MLYDKYIVIKKKDIAQYLSPVAQKLFDRILQTIVEGRLKDGKNINTYLVVNEDEIYSKTVKDLILKEVNENGEQDTNLDRRGI